MKSLLQTLYQRLGLKQRAADRRAPAHLAALVASADDAIVSKDLNGIITSWNPGAEAMFGYTAAQALGQSITLIIPAERLNEEVEILRRLRRGEAIRHFETERVRSDGRRVPISLAVSPMRDASGRIIGASKIARDITERRRAEGALREAVQRLEALYRLADGVGRAKDLTAVCEAAVEAVIAIGATRASLLLFDDAGVMRFRAWRNLSSEYRAAVEGHSPWSRDSSDPQPIVVDDVTTEPALASLRDVIAAEGIRSLAFVPLVNHGQLLGKFTVYYDTPHAFSAEELRLAAGIAQHVAFGLARVVAEASVEDLLRREQLARREAEAARVEADERRTIAEELARLAKVMTETLDVAEVGARVVEAALSLFRARGSGLRLAAPDGSLVGIAFAGTMKAFTPGHTVTGGPLTVSGLAMLRGETVSSEDCFADSRLQMAPDIREGMRVMGDATVLAAPLRTGTRVFGALSIADRLGRSFSSADAVTLQAFADQAALALENARLYEEARRRQREAEVVAELAQRMNASLDLHTTLDRLVEGARELCAGDIARIVVRNPATGRMVLRHQVGSRWTGYGDDTVVEPGCGSGGIVLHTRKPFRTDDYARDSRISDHYMKARDIDGTITQIVVPIPGDTEIAGLLYVDRRTSRAFTDADEAVLLRLADHAATAIRNSQLFAAERAARAEADAANRGKDQFLAVLSHELRTPLNAILGWARLLTAGHLDEAQRVHASAVIERNAWLQAQLVGDLLDLSRIAAGKMEIDREPVDLALVVREAVEALAADVEAKHLALVTALDDRAGEVLGEARRLQQIVSNLLSNAIKFTPEGGRIEVRLARHETSARLTVADTGQGIDPAVLSRIFDPFEQGDRSTTRRHQGLGLGLAIVKQLVELHGGAIRAESAGHDRGATFTVDLPVLAVRLDRRSGPDFMPAPRAPSAVLSGTRVLIVDDQPDARDLLGLALTGHGADVRVAASARAALEILAAEDIDVLVSDISMPDVDGYALVQRARELHRDGRPPIYALAVTAYTGRDVRDRALAVGFDAHATKPLTPELFVALLRGRRRPPHTTPA
jgi:PAS domain S-box-containing protein